MFDDGEEDTTGGSEREDMEDMDIGDSPWKPLKQPNKEETQKKRSFQVPASWSCGRTKEHSSVLMDVCWEIREQR